MPEPIAKTFKVPMHAHARKVLGKSGFQGILRMDGKTILYTSETYETEQEAASEAVLAQVKVMREINSFYGLFGNADGETSAKASFTHIKKEGSDV